MVSKFQLVNLGKKGKSIHLLEPLTSKPIIGTKTKKIKQIKNNNIDILNILLSDKRKKNKKIIPNSNKC